MIKIVRLLLTPFQRLDLNQPDILDASPYVSYSINTALRPNRDQKPIAERFFACDLSLPRSEWSRDVGVPLFCRNISFKYSARLKFSLLNLRIKTTFFFKISISYFILLYLLLSVYLITATARAHNTTRFLLLLNTFEHR